MSYALRRREMFRRARRRPELARRGRPAHVDADGRALLAGAYLNQLAELIDEPQTSPGLRARAGFGPPGERAAEAAFVVDLAQQGVSSVPDAKLATAAGVLDRV